MGRLASFRSVRFMLFGLGVLLLARPAVAQAPPPPPPFSMPFPSPVVNPAGPVTYGGAFKVATPFMFMPGNHVSDWYVQADSSGLLTVTVQAGTDPLNDGNGEPFTLPFAGPYQTVTATVFRARRPFGGVAGDGRRH